MKWLIDIGNSRIKWARSDGTRITDVRAAANDRMADAELWKNIQIDDSVWIASVAGESVNRQVNDLIAERTSRVATFVHSVAHACGVRNAYAAPERLGVDRFLALIAARARIPRTVVIASCGTALTLDAIDGTGRHLGGLIAPSPDLMQASLRERTAKLRDVAATAVVEIADSTDAAVMSGTWLAAVALVERFVERVPHDEKMPTLILTGGGADALAALIAIPHVVCNDLVLEGLAIRSDVAL
ncbi:MAG: type III pantothenate kinase [Rudaea sp.]